MLIAGVESADVDQHTSSLTHRLNTVYTVFFFRNERGRF